MAANPRKRRARRSSTRSYKRRRNPAARGFGFGDFMNKTLMPSATGAIGAIGLDLLLGFLPLPLAIKTGPMRPLVRIAGAIGLGMVAGFVAPKRMAEQFTAGAVTVVLYDTIKGFLKPMLPQLGAYDDEMTLLGYQSAGVFSPDELQQLPDNSGMDQYPEEMGVYDQPGMGVYNQ